MTTLIRKIANNLTSSLNLFLISICDLVTNVTFKVTRVTKKLHHIKPTGFEVSYKNQQKVNVKPGGGETTGLSLSHTLPCYIIKVVALHLFEISSGNPIIKGDVKNDKN